ncbi:MAG: hypothetical protein FWG93_03315 [Oscillospiraceae bacterium]|nr:hypothetical protein [Oscillospiraceae bacterium]
MTLNWRDAARGLGKYKVILPVILLGLLMILWPSSGKTPEAADVSYAPFPLRETEQSLEAALGAIAGAGQVKVMLTLKTDMTLVLQEDVKQRNDVREEGAASTSLTEREAKTVLTGGSSGRPVVIRRVYPEFRGALVVCEGGADPRVRLAVVQAVSSLTGLGSDKITVTAMKD